MALALSRDSLQLRPVRQAAPQRPLRSHVAKARRSLWDVLVFSTPALDELHRAWALAGQANGAAMAIPSVPKAAGGLAASRAGGILGRIGLLGTLERVLGSGAFQAVSRFLSRPIIQTAGHIASRVAPFIGAGFAFFDIRRAWRTHHDANASDMRKGLTWLKAGISTVGAGAGLATLVLAPTGAGGAIAGAVALGAGFAAMGLEFLTNKLAPR
jgi:hypothetical protein